MDLWSIKSRTRIIPTVCGKAVGLENFKWSRVSHLMSRYHLKLINYTHTNRNSPWEQVPWPYWDLLSIKPQAFDVQSFTDISWERLSLPEPLSIIDEYFHSHGPRYDEPQIRLDKTRTMGTRLKLLLLSAEWR